MPITKSAKKALRQSQKRKKQNLVWKTEIKKLEKEMRKLIEEKKEDEAKKILPRFYKTIDKAVKNNVLKKNTGARKKSRLAKLLSTKQNRN